MSSKDQQRRLRVKRVRVRQLTPLTTGQLEAVGGGANGRGEGDDWGNGKNISRACG